MALKKILLPVIPTRGFIIFPGTVFHFDVARKKSIAAIEKAISGDGHIFLCGQKNEVIEDPVADDIYDFGTVAKIKQMIKIPHGGVRVLVEGISRGKTASLFITDEMYSAEVVYKKSSTTSLSSEEYSAFLHQIHILISEYLEFNPKLSSESFLKDMPEDDPSALCDTVAENLVRNVSDKQNLLSITSVKKRLVKLLETLSRDLKVMDIESVISARVKEQMEEHNHDYYLREQLKAIRTELGEFGDEETNELRNLIDSIALPDEVYEKAMRELKNLEKLPATSPENAISRHYLEVVTKLPWDRKSEVSNDISKSKKILNDSHYGMEKVKERIAEQLAVIIRTQKPCGSILCLLGAPGVGKTSIAKAIAEATGREYVRISLGGMHDEAELRGHRKTYIGAMPGRIVNALIQAGASNPVILLDEIDKIGSDYKGDPASALLEILDSEQNVSFRDNFLEVGVDLSEVLFVCTANTLDTVPAPLIDRLEIIELSSYTDDEKLSIAKEYLIPKQMKKHALSKKELVINDSAVRKLICDYTRESGVRNLEREIGSICRKAVMALEEKTASKISVNAKNLADFSGPQKYLRDTVEGSDTVGIVNGLAWTQAGGEILQCEASIVDGSGKIQITGKLGDVMKESAQAAVSFVRSIAGNYNVDKNFYEKKDIHIHFPEGAVPKDGPSAGITIATAVLSALAGIPVRNAIAMTGEISLRGRVLPIGGLREKSLAAYRLGIREIIIPKANKKDLADIPSDILSQLNVHTVTDCNEVFMLSLASNIKKNDALIKNHCIERKSDYEYTQC